MLLQKFLNGDVDLRTIEQRDLKVILSGKNSFSWRVFLAFVERIGIEIYVINGR